MARGGSLFFTHDPGVADPGLRRPMAGVVETRPGRYGEADTMEQVEGLALS